MALADTTKRAPRRTPAAAQLPAERPSRRYLDVFGLTGLPAEHIYAPGGERVTLQQVIEETVAKVPPLPVPGSTAKEIGDGTPRRRNSDFTATEVPEGKAQLKFFEDGDQWVPRGHVVRCQILSDAAIEPDLEEKFVSIDGRDFTLAEFMKMVGSFGGWGMRTFSCVGRDLRAPSKSSGFAVPAIQRLTEAVKRSLNLCPTGRDQRAEAVQNAPRRELGEEVGDIG